jgi:hypothetical protein
MGAMSRLDADQEDCIRIGTTAGARRRDPSPKVES